MPLDSYEELSSIGPPVRFWTIVWWRNGVVVSWQGTRPVKAQRLRHDEETVLTYHIEYRRQPWKHHPRKSKARRKSEPDTADNPVARLLEGMAKLLGQKTTTGETEDA